MRGLGSGLNLDFIAVDKEWLNDQSISTLSDHCGKGVVKRNTRLVGY
jgi:hypothetical protein